MKVAALAGKAQHAQRHVNNGVDIVDRAGLRGRRPHRRDRDDGARARGGRRGRPHAGARGRRDRHRAPRSRRRSRSARRACGWARCGSRRRRASSSPEGIEAYIEATSSDTVRSRSLHRASRRACCATRGPTPGKTRTGPVRSACRCRTSSPPRRTRASRAAHRKDLAFAPVGQIVGSMNEVQAGARRDVPPGRGVHRDRRATRREPRHRPELTPTVTVPALAGMRVVDATEGIAGGYATKLLRDLGAEVTKVERPGGDPLRWWSAATPDEPVVGDGRALRVPRRGQGDRRRPTTPLPSATCCAPPT